jgi:negative regulator of sigma E activity
MPNEDLVSAYLDGECTDEERRWVEDAVASSPELRAVFDDVQSARDAVRALPMRDAPPEFWAHLLAGTDALDTDAALVVVAADVGAPVRLDDRRDRRSPSRWLVAMGGAAAAAVIAVVVLVPQPESVNPPVAAFTDAHAVRSSLQDDAVSSLAPLAVQAGFRR